MTDKKPNLRSVGGKRFGKNQVMFDDAVEFLETWFTDKTVVDECIGTMLFSGVTNKTSCNIIMANPESKSGINKLELLGINEMMKDKLKEAFQKSEDTNDKLRSLMKMFEDM